MLRLLRVRARCLLLPWVPSACCRCRKRVAELAILRDECGSEFYETVGKARYQTLGGRAAAAAAAAESSDELLLHRCRREEGGRQEDGGCNEFFVAGGPGGGALR